MAKNQSKEKHCNKEKDCNHNRSDSDDDSKQCKKEKCDKCTLEKIRAYYVTLLLILFLGLGVLFVINTILFPVIPIPTTLIKPKLLLSNPAVTNVSIVKNRIPLLFTQREDIPKNQTLYSYQSGYKDISAIIQTLRNVTTRYMFNITILPNQGISSLTFEFLVLSCPNLPYVGDYQVNPECTVVDDILIPIIPVDQSLPIQFSYSASETVALTKENPQLFGIVSIFSPNQISIKYKNLNYDVESLGSF